MAASDKERIRQLEEDVANLEKQVGDLEQQLEDQQKAGQFAQQTQARHAKALKVEGYRSAALGVPDYNPGPTVKTLDDKGNWVNKDGSPDTMNKFWIEEMGFTNPALGGPAVDETEG